jgi:hypothetical protein
VPGIGENPGLTILHEIGDLDRFPIVNDFLSCSRLVKGCVAALAGSSVCAAPSSAAGWPFHPGPNPINPARRAQICYQPPMDRKDSQGRTFPPIPLSS